ncbi:MAG TPA: DUF3105 domain-containing protein [Acidimicrobiia bacterium]|nr:DUF3105 domain-containing protein [Acidimicrobiia bacterium]
MARTSNKSAKSTPDPSTKKKPTPWGGIITGAVVVLGIGALLAFDQPPPGVEFPSQGNFHLASIDQSHEPYNSSPPSSGPHVGFLANWGVHEDPVPEQLFVHNLEDGGVVITYDCPDGCADLRTGLTELVGDVGGRVVLTPYEGIEHEGVSYRAAAVAWTRVFYFDELTEEDESELRTFIRLYEGIDHHAR